jgi:hypothetical protein
VRRGGLTGAITSEVDRYCANPGEAYGYKVGHTEFVRLRVGAKADLGPKLDIRDLNDAVASTGGIRISILDSVVQRHIAGETARCRGRGHCRGGGAPPGCSRKETIGQSHVSWKYLRTTSMILECYGFICYSIRPFQPSRPNS